MSIRRPTDGNTKDSDCRLSVRVICMHFQFASSEFGTLRHWVSDVSKDRRWFSSVHISDKSVTSTPAHPAGSPNHRTPLYPGRTNSALSFPETWTWSVVLRFCPAVLSPHAASIKCCWHLHHCLDIASWQLVPPLLFTLLTVERPAPTSSSLPATVRESGSVATPW
jgi:hypothetical protein